MYFRDCKNTKNRLYIYILTYYLLKIIAQLTYILYIFAASFFQHIHL